MSAFIVNDETITGMLQAMSRRFNPHGVFTYYWEGKPHREFSSVLGQELVNENYRSVNYRYREDEEPREFNSVYKYLC